MNLSQASEREDLVVLSVNTDYRRKKHLENLSLMKGSQISCLYNRSGDVVVKIQEGRIAINKEFASLIEVRSLNPQDYREENGKRKPTPEAEERFRKEDEEYKVQEEKGRAELKKIQEERKIEIKAEKEKEKQEEKEAEAVNFGRKEER